MYPYGLYDLLDVKLSLNRKKGSGPKGRGLNIVSILRGTPPGKAQDGA